MKKVNTVLQFLLLFFAASAAAEIRLPGLVGNNMILQRSVKVPVWGWADPGEQIQVTFKGKIYKTTAATADGKWMVKLNAADAGGPFDLEIKGVKDVIRIQNILVGDVWLCSGQSNMVFDFNNQRARALYASDIAASANDQIRQVIVNRGYASQPADNCKTTGWRMASPQTINSFSAVAYFYARNLYDQYHVPIGIINSSLGGTIAEAWTSAEGLKELPRYAKDLSFLQDTSALNTKVRDFQKKVTDWDKQVVQDDKGYDQDGKPVWAMPGIDDHEWATMPSPGFWDKNGYGTFFGSVWFRKEIEVPETAIGKDAVITLGQIDDADITYFNGQVIGKGINRDSKRRYIVPAALIRQGKNILAIRVVNYNGTGGIFPADSLSFKSGTTTPSLSGSWKFNKGIKMEIRPGTFDPKNLPSSLYNAMIAPLQPYAVKGVVWYQGEYNAHQAYAYRPLLQALIRDWRSKWRQGNMPFIIAQLPNFQQVYDHPIESEWAELREAQCMALSLPNTAIAVTIDAGEAGDIHPVNKKDVGYRLALASRKLVYAEQSLVASGPVYKNMRLDGSKVIISFETYGSQMISKGGGDLKFFAIAGDDKKFVWAKAVIKGNAIEVSSPAVPHPAAVRYAWAGNAEGCNLYNADGLPASPFRTDTWPGMTVNN